MGAPVWSAFCDPRPAPASEKRPVQPGHRRPAREAHPVADLDQLLLPGGELQLVDAQARPLRVLAGGAGARQHLHLDLLLAAHRHEVEEPQGHGRVPAVLRGDAGAVLPDVVLGDEAGQRERSPSWKPPAPVERAGAWKGLSLAPATREITQIPGEPAGRGARRPANFHPERRHGA